MDYASEHKIRAAKARLEKAIFRVDLGRDNRGNTYSGTGFFIGREYALTAAHNLIKHPGIGKSEAPSPLRAWWRTTAIQLTWKCEHLEAESDIAVLTVEGDLPDGAETLPLAALDPEADRSYREDFWRGQAVVFAGYPYQYDALKGGPAALGLVGNVARDTPILVWPDDYESPLGRELVGLKIHGAQVNFRGISGGPVWDIARDRVIAVCSFQPNQEWHLAASELAHFLSNTGFLETLGIRDLFQIWPYNSVRRCQVAVVANDTRWIWISAMPLSRDHPSAEAWPPLPALQTQSQRAMELIVPICRTWPGTLGELYRKFAGESGLNSAEFRFTPPPPGSHPSVLAAAVAAYLARCLRDFLRNDLELPVDFERLPFLCLAGLTVQGDDLTSPELNWFDVSEQCKDRILLLTRKQDEQAMEARRIHNLKFEGAMLRQLDEPKDLINQVLIYFSQLLRRDEITKPIQAGFAERIKDLLRLEKEAEEERLRRTSFERKLEAVGSQLQLLALQTERLRYWIEVFRRRDPAIALPSLQAILDELDNLERDFRIEEKKRIEEAVGVRLEAPAVTPQQVEDAGSKKKLFWRVVMAVGIGFENVYRDAFELMLSKRDDLKYLRSFEGAFVGVGEGRIGQSPAETLAWQVERFAYLAESRRILEKRMSELETDKSDREQTSGPYTDDEFDTAMRRAREAFNQSWADLRREMK